MRFLHFFHAEKGDHTGSSQVWKSTFLRSINLLETPTLERFSHRGQNVLIPVWSTHYREKWEWLSKKFNFENLNVLENYRCTNDRPQSAIVKPWESCQRKPWKVVYGISILGCPSETTFRWSKQRVAIARPLYGSWMPFFLRWTDFCPRPRNGWVSWKLMQDLAKEGLTMIVVTYEMEFHSSDVSSLVIFMDKGVIAWARRSKEIFSNPKEERPGIPNASLIWKFQFAYHVWKQVVFFVHPSSLCIKTREHNSLVFNWNNKLIKFWWFLL